MRDLEVTSVRLREANDRDQRKGVIAYGSVLIDGALRVGGLAVRRTRSGDVRVSFPACRDSQGREHSIVCPISADAHLAVEGAVLAEMRARGLLHE